LARNEEAKLIMRVVDGLDVFLKCQASYVEPKVVLKPESGDLAFGKVYLFSSCKRTFTLKNCSRLAATFFVEPESVPLECSVSPSAGLLSGGESREFTFRVFLKEVRSLRGVLAVQVRGGKTVRLAFSADAIVPDILVSEEEFDFGNITVLGSSESQLLTIENRSLISVLVFIDLRDSSKNASAPDGVQCLCVMPVDENDDSVLEAILDESQLENDSSRSRQLLGSKAHKTYDDDEDDVIEL